MTEQEPLKGEAGAPEVPQSALRMGGNIFLYLVVLPTLAVLAAKWIFDL